MTAPVRAIDAPIAETDRASMMILIARHYEAAAEVARPWLGYHLAKPSAFGLQLVAALAACELIVPGLGFGLTTDLAKIPYDQGPKGRERFQNLLQKLIEVAALRAIVEHVWPEGSILRHEPANPVSGKKPELLVETPDRVFLFEVKAPGLLDHQDARHANPQQVPARSSFSQVVREHADYLDQKTTLPQDNKLKDFLVSAEEKFAGFQTVKPQTGVLIVAWDDYMYEPISSLNHPESGLFTEASFFKTQDGARTPFSAVDGALLLNHLALMHAATHEDHRRHRDDPFVISKGSPSPNVWCPNIGGMALPQSLYDAFDAVPAEAMTMFADYAPQEFVMWMNPMATRREIAARRRKAEHVYGVSAAALLGLR